MWTNKIKVYNIALQPWRIMHVLLPDTYDLLYYLNDDQNWYQINQK